MGRTHAFGADRWSCVFEICRHPTEIPMDSRKHLIFSQLRWSAVSVTWGSFFVESHDNKMQQETVRVRQRCAFSLWEFSSRGAEGHAMVSVVPECVRLSLTGAWSIYSRVRSGSPTVSRTKLHHLEG